jgi:hypothetical protein
VPHDSTLLGGVHFTRSLTCFYVGFSSVFRLHLQHHNLTHLQMNAIERHFYRRQHDVSCGSLQVPPDLLASLLSRTPAWAAARDF